MKRHRLDTVASLVNLKGANAGWSDAVGIQPPNLDEAGASFLTAANRKKRLSRMKRQSMNTKCTT